MSFVRRFYKLSDGRISAVHFNAHAGVPRIVFANANGFNGLAYRQILEPLGVHAIGLDLRGHGMSELPTDIKKLKNWHIFRDDIAAFINQELTSPIILAGHSFGAVSALLACAKVNQTIAGYVGLDPVTIPFLSRNMTYLPGMRSLMKSVFPIARNAGRRRYVFPSTEAAFDRYQGRGAFKKMPDAMLHDYLQGGLKPHPDGVQLACHPKWEQAIFTAQGHNIFKGARSLPANSHIVYGGKAAVSDPISRARMARIIRPGRIEFHPNYHHLFPFHRPDDVRAVFDQVISRAGF